MQGERGVNSTTDGKHHNEDDEQPDPHEEKGFARPTTGIVTVLATTEEGHEHGKRGNGLVVQAADLNRAVTLGEVGRVKGDHPECNFIRIDGTV